MNISIRVENNMLIFDYAEDIEILNINNTNIIDVDSLSFSMEYIRNNPVLIKHFLSILILKYQVEDVLFKVNDLAKEFIPLIDDLKVREVTLLENKAINYDIYKLLSETENISIINVYLMQPYMFDALTNRFNKLVRTKVVLELESFLAKDNKFLSYSDIYYKKNLYIKHLFKRQDYVDLDDFLNVNRHLENVYIYKFDLDMLNELVHLIKKYNKRNINIIFSYNKNYELKRINNFKEQNKALYMNRDIHIDYQYNISSPKDYYKRNYVKNIVQISMLLAISLLLLLVLIYVAKNALDKKKTLDTLNSLDTIKDNYLALKDINKDYIGWLNVNNTSLNAPVLKYRNGYYNERNFYKTKNFNGWITSMSMGGDELITVSLDSVLASGLKDTLNKDWYTLNNNHVITYKKELTETYEIVSLYESNSLAFKRSDILQNSIYNFKTNFNEKDNLLTIRACSNKCIFIHSRRVK